MDLSSQGVDRLLLACKRGLHRIRQGSNRSIRGSFHGIKCELRGFLHAVQCFRDVMSRHVLNRFSCSICYIFLDICYSPGIVDRLAGWINEFGFSVLINLLK